MPFVRDLTAIVTTLVSAAAELLREAAQNAVRILRDHIPETKRRVLLIGVPAVLLLAGIGLLLLTKKPETASPPVQRVPVQRLAIPAEDLFLPDEPDFVPGVLLERERRSVWTAEDAAPYWQDPLRYGEEPWRDRVEAAVDELLEHVP